MKINLDRARAAHSLDPENPGKFTQLVKQKHESKLIVGKKTNPEDIVGYYGFKWFGIPNGLG